MAKTRQERTASPSSSTVHAPQTPCSQPTCVPVRPRSCRRKSERSSRGSTESSWRVPLTVTAMGPWSSTRGSLTCRRAERYARGEGAQGRAEPVSPRDAREHLDPRSPPPLLQHALEALHHGFLHGDVHRGPPVGDRPECVSEHLDDLEAAFRQQRAEGSPGETLT